MVERRLRRRGIHDARVLAAMAAVPRELFLPAELRTRAYEDCALPIAAGQTISQPWIVAFMCSQLELRGDECVLEVGTGSGYGAAVLQLCCREVVTVERSHELAALAASRLSDLGYGNVEVRTGDGSAGVPERAPFDAIAVTAAAEHDPPGPLLGQLAAGGRLVCPLRTEAGEHLVRHRDGVRERTVPVRFVPLVPGEER